MAPDKIDRLSANRPVRTAKSDAERQALRRDRQDISGARVARQRLGWHDLPVRPIPGMAHSLFGEGVVHPDDAEASRFTRSTFHLDGCPNFDVDSSTPYLEICFGSPESHPRIAEFWQRHRYPIRIEHTNGPPVNRFCNGTLFAAEPKQLVYVGDQRPPHPAVVRARFLDGMQATDASVLSFFSDGGGATLSVAGLHGVATRAFAGFLFSPGVLNWLIEKAGRSSSWQAVIPVGVKHDFDLVRSQFELCSPNQRWFFEHVM